jgi:hypothetical protein
MMLDAMTALLSLPRVISHKFNKSRMTVTRNLQQHVCFSATHDRTWHLCIRAFLRLPWMHCISYTVVHQLHTCSPAPLPCCH